MRRPSVTDGAARATLALSGELLLFVGRLDPVKGLDTLLEAVRLLAHRPTLTLLVAGGSVSYSVQVSAVNGFNDDVSLALIGLPSGVGSASFAPAVVSGAGSAQLTISTSSGAATGTYSLDITGTNDSTTHSAAISLVVSSPDFALSASPTSRTIKRGQSTSYAITVSAVGGFAGSVSLSLSGAPARTTTSWSANPVSASGTNTLTVRTTSKTPRGTYTLRITGKSGTLVHQVTMTLTVQ